MNGDEIRESFLSFFEDQVHLRVSSASLIPVGDPTLLLTNAGMVQFKPYFSGDSNPPNRRLTTAQKAFRTVDIDEVGDSTHLTLLEMLGNFSIGDYFKREAIEFSLKFVTDKLGLSQDDFSATVYLDDDEAYALWKEVSRATDQLENSISGAILSGPGAKGIVKTDNAHVLLFDPKTLDLVASQIINPFLPPLTFSVGQADTSRPLRGAYRLLVLTDKDGNPNRSSPGEVIGQLTPSIPLGTERVEYYMDRPFIRLPAELLAFSTDSPKTSIRGIITVHPKFLDQVDDPHGDRDDVHGHDHGHHDDDGSNLSRYLLRDDGDFLEEALPLFQIQEPVPDICRAGSSSDSVHL